MLHKPRLHTSIYIYFVVLLILFVVLVYYSCLHDNAHSILYICWDGCQPDLCLLGRKRAADWDKYSYGTKPLHWNSINDYKYIVCATRLEPQEDAANNYVIKEMNRIQREGEENKF